MNSDGQPLRVVLADDEPLARETLRNSLLEFEAIEIVGEARNGRELVELLKGKASIDVVFLDIEMPCGTGFDALRALDEPDEVAVVFVTAHSEYAVDAFETGGLDYVMKPFDRDRIERALRRVIRVRREREAEGALSRAKQLLERVTAVANRLPDRLAVEVSETLDAIEVRDAERDPPLVFKKAGRLIRVSPHELIWVEAADNYALLVLDRGRDSLVRATMRDLERRLDERRFVRTHRSAIVNLARVHRMESRPNGEAVLFLSNGDSVRVSRFRKKQVREALLRR